MTSSELIREGVHSVLPNYSHEPLRPLCEGRKLPHLTGRACHLVHTYLLSVCAHNCFQASPTSSEFSRVIKQLLIKWISSHSLILQAVSYQLPQIPLPKQHFKHLHPFRFQLNSSFSIIWVQLSNHLLHHKKGMDKTSAVTFQWCINIRLIPCWILVLSYIIIIHFFLCWALWKEGSRRTTCWVGKER